MENGTQMTFEEYMPEIFPEQTAGVSDSLVKTSALPESKLGLLETAQACFSELCTFLDSSQKKRSPLTYSLRMLKTCLVLMEDGISPDFSLKWIGGGYDAEWQVLNSKNFGVPQNRERCFIIGHFRGRSRRNVFPISAHGEPAAELQGCESVSTCLDTRLMADTRGTYPISGGVR